MPGQQAHGYAEESACDRITRERSEPGRQRADNLEQRPGAFVSLGGRSGSEYATMVHREAYEFNDELLPIAVRMLTRLIEKRLSV